MIALMYHSIGDSVQADPWVVAPREFVNQMGWLADHGYSGLSLRSAMEMTSDRNGPSVVLTFDDGYLDNYETAWPTFKKHGFSASIFVATDCLGHENSWVPLGLRKRLMTWEQAREMAAYGIEIGSHTASHLDVRQASTETIRDELVRSREAIAEHIGQAPVSFAYPYGGVRTEMPDLLQQTGYRWALQAVTWGRNTRHTDPYFLHRTPVLPGDTLAQFAAKVRGWYCWRYYTRKAINEGRWLWQQLAGRRLVCAK